MDPQSLLSRSTVPEIWPFQLAGTQRTAPVGRNSAMQEVGGSRDGSAEESTVTGQSCVGGRNGRRRTKARNAGIPAAVVSEDDSSKLACTSSGNDLIDCDGKRHKAEGSKDENGDSKTDMEENSAEFSKPTDQSATPPEAPKQDYIHVRARRGQATDSHSLAERARREKISERMKILQDLVPGCNKVIGKALVLDEIINYIQSLQRQVEFLSMKLEVVNSRMNSIIEEFPAKNFGVVQAFDHPGMPFSSQPEGEYAQAPQEWLHMQVGSSFARVT